MQKVSLLVTTYNAQDNLAITLQSIESQDYGNIEVVIVDGQSQDETPKLIRRFADMHHDEEDHITVRWISEPDRGLYDAMNKAWSMCTGDIVAVCNDRLCVPDTITKLVDAIENAGEDCVGAHADLVYMQGERVVRTWHMGDGELKDGWMPGHPTLFLKREIYEKYGVYDVRYRCAADYEFMVRFLKDRENHLVYVPEILIAMFYGGTSNAGLRNYLVSFKEGYQALSKNGVPHPLWITIKRTWKVLRQF
ncbi:MAG: glycosyltransferase family 2 protein [Lachnospiraceae bacterium]